MGRTASLLIVAFTLGVAPLLTTSPLRAEEAALITSYFEKLRDQGLFGLAERYAIDRRAELAVESAESVQLAVELSRTFAHHARVVATSDEQTFLQTRADEALADYRGDERYPRIEAVELERTYRAIDRAELAWWSSTADPEDLGARKSAGEHLLKARSALQDWIDSAADSAAKPVASRGPEDLTRRELGGLIHAARLKSIDLILLTADLAATKGEKEKLIRQAEDVMKRLASSGERGTTATIRGYKVRIARLLGDEDALKRLVRESTTERMPLGVRQDAVAELARHQLDQGHYEAAARLLVESKETLGAINDRLRALHVEAVLGMSRSAGQNPQLLANAESELAKVAGPWRLRDEYLLQVARQVQAYGEQAAALVRRGNREFRAGAHDQAIATFRDAADAATVPTGRAELRFMTASLLVEAEKFAEAIAECELVARDSPTEQLTARASLLTAYCRGRISTKSGNADDRGQYERALVEHLRRFPKDETVGDAAWMLGTLAEQEGRLATIVDADQRMPEEHPKAAESTSRAVQAVLRAQEELRSTGAGSVDSRDASAWDADADRLAKRLLAETADDLAGAQRMLTGARLLAAVSMPKFDAVLAILDRVPRPQMPNAAGEGWRQLANDVAALRLVCLTATGQFADAAATLEQLQSISVDELLDVLRKLSTAGKQLAGPQRSELAKLELTAITRIRLQAKSLSPADQQLLAECQGEALYASGRYADAARMFEEAMPGKPELAPRLADALEKSGQPADLTRALELWRKQQALKKQGTAAWFQSSFRIARILLALGQAAECRKLIVTTRIVYPELGGPDLKQAFDELDRQAAAKAGK
jgi:TolA-binding protein